jgi:hypothetical protein
MAFKFHIHTERMSSCNHEAVSDANQLDHNSDTSATTYSYFCTRCDAITVFNACLVCQQCMYQLGS